MMTVTKVTAVALQAAKNVWNGQNAIVADVNGAYMHELDTHANEWVIPPQEGLGTLTWPRKG